MIHQERIDEIRDQITEKRTAAGYYATVAKVIEKWNGKMYNKRMSEDLRAATGGMFSSDKNYGWLSIDYSHSNRGKWYFIPMCKVKLELLENKRINANLLIESLREYREMRLKEAQDLENTLENLDTLTGQIEALKKTCRALFQNVPTVILDAIGESRYTLRY